MPVRVLLVCSTCICILLIQTTMLYKINCYYCQSRRRNIVWRILLFVMITTTVLLLSDVCNIRSRRNVASILVESFTITPVQVQVHVHVSLSSTTTLITTTTRIARQSRIITPSTTITSVNRIQSRHSTLLRLLQNENSIILYKMTRRRRIRIHRILKEQPHHQLVQTKQMLSSLSLSLSYFKYKYYITLTNQGLNMKTILPRSRRLLVLLLSSNDIDDEYIHESNDTILDQNGTATAKAILTTNMKKQQQQQEEQNQKDAININTELNNQLYNNQEQYISESQQQFSASDVSSSSFSSYLSSPGSSTNTKTNSNNSTIPKHIGIVMDGNTRWAKQNNVPIFVGHTKGATTLLNCILPYLQTITNIQYITLYIFSTENWNRPYYEINHLLVLMEQSCQQLYTLLLTNKQYTTLYINIIGNIHDTRIPTTLRTKLLQLQNFTYHRTRQYDSDTIVTVSLAINYGGRQDIVQACQSIISDILQNQSLLLSLEASSSSSSLSSSSETDLNSSSNLSTPPTSKAYNTGSTNYYSNNKNTTTLVSIPIITEDILKSYLYTSTLPYPDLIIRSSGEYRLSNFLLWDSAYTELYISSTLWPDFNISTINDALHWYSTRSRRFGTH